MTDQDQETRRGAIVTGESITLSIGDEVTAMWTGDEGTNVSSTIRITEIQLSPIKIVTGRQV